MHGEDKAIAEFEKAIELSGGRPAPYLDYLGHAYAASGKTAEAEKILAELEEQQFQKGTGGPAFRVATLAALGRKQEALEALHEGYISGDGALIWILVDPRYDALRGDPRFTNMANQIRGTKQD